MSHQSLVLDANILVRAVLGQRVFKLLNQYYDTTAFFAPDEALLRMPRSTSRQSLLRVVWTGASVLRY